MRRLVCVRRPQFVAWRPTNFRDLAYRKRADNLERERVRHDDFGSSKLEVIRRSKHTEDYPVKSVVIHKSPQFGEAKVVSIKLDDLFQPIRLACDT